MANDKVLLVSLLGRERPCVFDVPFDGNQCSPEVFYTDTAAALVKIAYPNRPFRFRQFKGKAFRNGSSLEWLSEPEQSAKLTPDGFLSEDRFLKARSTLYPYR